MRSPDWVAIYMRSAINAGWHLACSIHYWQAGLIEACFVGGA
jgi:hypothetical protein